MLMLTETDWGRRLWDSQQGKKPNMGNSKQDSNYSVGGKVMKHFKRTKSVMKEVKLGIPIEDSLWHFSWETGNYVANK